MLTALAIKNPIFHKIVNTKSHEIDIKNERYGLNRKIVWKNTNKLLESGWQGVKTGTT
jgi:D-alanyl-D-alanine carboxypeptidase